MVRAEGSVGIWPTRALYQLRAVALSLVGEGKLAAEVEDAARALARRRPLRRLQETRDPSVSWPSRAGNGATTTRARTSKDAYATDAPLVEVRFFETRVQGKGAEIEIAEAVDRASRAKVDVVVITRGGGSTTIG